MNTVEIGTSTVNNFIDGHVVAGSTGRTQDIFNPATGRKARSVCLSSAADVDAAVQAAKAAFPAWANLPPLRRVRLMNKYLA
ncbi:MAG: aldehyde dehydrogenase family protein, partial [Proteobacteria bacterium]|nr:aldehyde dehydrogenase family protein [Pseudomonadota bacterium]